MKKKLLLLILASSAYAFAQNNTKDIASIQFDNQEKRIQYDLEKIIDTDNPRNYKNIRTLNKVSDYIKNSFAKVCDTVSFQSFDVNNKTYRNVIASLGIEYKQRIIIGAHYDVCGNSDGADDNASGIVGLLELARLLSKEKLHYRIDFVAYTLEEPPFFRTEQMGSYIHAKSLFDKKIDVKGMICLESIGYFNENENSQNYPIREMKLMYGTKGDFITIVQNEKSGSFSKQVAKSMETQKLIKTVSFKGSSLVKGVDFSDHLNYWKFNYDAVMITNTAMFRNKNYHTNNDNLETLDIEKMILVIQQAYNAILTYH